MIKHLMILMISVVLVDIARLSGLVFTSTGQEFIAGLLLFCCFLLVELDSFRLALIRSYIEDSPKKEFNQIKAVCEDN